MSFEVGERTLSPEVSKLLQKFLGCQVASEGILAERKQFDFFIILNGSRIVVELKVGLEKLNSAIVQAEKSWSIREYPSTVRREPERCSFSARNV